MVLRHKEQVAWDSNSQEEKVNIFASMPSHVGECIGNHGGETHH